MIMEVIAEGLDMGNDVRHTLRSKMAGEQDWMGVSKYEDDTISTKFNIPKVTYPISPDPELLTPGTS